MSSEKYKESPIWFYATIILSILSGVTGITGIVDGFVEWKESFQPMMELYTSFKSWILSWISGSFVFDWCVIGNALWISNRFGKKRRDQVQNRNETNSYSLKDAIFHYPQIIIFWPYYLYDVVVAYFDTPPYCFGDYAGLKTYFRTLLAIIVVSLAIAFIFVDYQKLN